MYYAQPRLTDITFVALDTETTDLQPIMHRLVEIGAVRFRLDGWELATFQQLIDPEIPIPPEVRQVHGITDAMVRRKPTIERVLPQFINSSASLTPFYLHTMLHSTSVFWPWPSYD